MARVLACLLVLALLPVVAGHPAEDTLLPAGSYLNHTEVWNGTVAAGGTVNTTLAFGGAPLRAGWFLLFSGEAAGLHADLRHDGRSVATWSWNGPFLATVRLPETGVYGLELRNEGAGTAPFRLYYDQTCECSSKAVHGDGPLWFNLEARAGERVELAFAVVPYQEPGAPADGDRDDVTVHATLARALPEAATWPEGFLLLDEARVTIPAGNAAPYTTFPLPFTAGEDGMHYVLVDVRHDGPPGWSFQVKPRWSVEAADVRSAEAPAVPAVLLSVLALAGAALRRR